MCRGMTSCTGTRRYIPVILAKRLLAGTLAQRRPCRASACSRWPILMEVADLDIKAGIHELATLSPRARTSTSTSAARVRELHKSRRGPRLGRHGQRGARQVPAEPHRGCAHRAAPEGPDQPLRVDVSSRSGRPRCGCGSSAARCSDRCNTKRGGFPARARRAHHVRVHGPGLGGGTGAAARRLPCARPAAAAPAATRQCTRSSVERNGRYHFEVEARLPVFGLLVRYAGWLEPEA